MAIDRRACLRRHPGWTIGSEANIRLKTLRVKCEGIFQMYQTSAMLQDVHDDIQRLSAM